MLEEIGYTSGREGLEVEMLRYILGMYKSVKNTKLYTNTHKIQNKTG